MRTASAPHLHRICTACAPHVDYPSRTAASGKSSVRRPCCSSLTRSASSSSSARRTGTCPRPSAPKALHAPLLRTLRPHPPPAPLPPPCATPSPASPPNPAALKPERYGARRRLGWDIRLEQARPACAVPPGPDAARSISAASRDDAAAAIASPAPATLALAPPDLAASATEAASPPASSTSLTHAAGLRPQSMSDDRRQVAIQPGPRVSGAAGAASTAGTAGTAGAAGTSEQARCGSVTGILKEPRAYPPGAASTQASTDCTSLCHPVQSSLQPSRDQPATPRDQPATLCMQAPPALAATRPRPTTRSCASCPPTSRWVRACRLTCRRRSRPAPTRRSASR